MHLSLVILGTCTIGPLSCYCVIYHLRYLVARLFTFLLPPSDFCHRDLTSTKGLSFATEKNVCRQAMIKNVIGSRAVVVVTNNWG